MFDGLISSLDGVCRNKDETVRNRRIVANRWVFFCGGNMEVHHAVILHTAEKEIA